MSVRTIVAGNWKMHTDAAGSANLLDAIAAWCAIHPGSVEVFVAPPFPFLASAVERVSRMPVGSGEGTIVIAAQNCHQEEEGAYTGEVSVPMLKSLGVRACIVGHSERREYFGETDAVVGQKIVQLLKHGLQPIYCCGERREEREKGRFLDVISTQLHSALGALPASDIAKLIVAYEPVWAIGTGLTASPEQAQEIHAFIRAELRMLAGDAADDIPILYGGSCNPGNAKGIFAGKDVNGGLIGGAALVAEKFTELVRIAQEVKSSV